TIPSRFLEELPEQHIEIAETSSSYGGYGTGYGSQIGGRNPYGASRFDNAGQSSFNNSYSTPGWQRAQQNRNEATNRNWGSRSGHAVERIGYGEVDSGYGAGRTSVKGRTIEGELVAKSVTTTESPFKLGDRVFHQKFVNGNVAAIAGNKLTIDFDKAGQKRVLDGFVTAV